MSSISLYPNHQLNHLAELRHNDSARIGQTPQTSMSARINDPVLQLLIRDAQTALLRLRTYYNEELSEETFYAPSASDHTKLLRLSLLAAELSSARGSNES